LAQEEHNARNPASEPDAEFTVGHGNRSPQAHLDILLCAGITCVVDVRAHLMLRRHPGVSHSVLPPFLEEAGII
jgi:uncharacterized protein (DUF488 family)